MKKYLWIGSFVTDELAAQLRERGYKNPASVTSQKNILEGIEAVTGQTFECVGLLAQSGYPRQKDAYFREITFSHSKAASGDVLVGHLNVTYLNRFTGKKSLVKRVRAWAKKNRGEEIEVFVYEMRSACLAAANALKKIAPRARVHLIVPDLPHFMDLNMGGAKKLLKKLDWSSITKTMSCVDSFILYTAKMAEFLGLPDGKWMVMEGSINRAEIERFDLPDSEIRSESDEGKIAVMYSGSIQRGFQIESLLKAFEYLDNGYELWITGSGDARALVEEYAAKNDRIKYYGFLPTREETLALQRRSTMLVNMRDPDAAASDYCFPSKLFEYMLTTRPVLSCRLGGIPEEYYDHLFEMDGVSPKEIAEGIKKVAAVPRERREALGSSAARFVAEKKNNIEQARRIIDFINC